ncbi:hypothetical protein GJ496_003299 [Pomphorhynchus laevis]|nr:hypothetical protein GJ496_003299 [Pomphorhynchus laevis]KAI0979624.1 hypothetical protein GJ496_003299 [Pomphorhynchus laevis]
MDINGGKRFKLKSELQSLIEVLDPLVSPVKFCPAINANSNDSIDSAMRIPKSANITSCELESVEQRSVIDDIIVFYVHCFTLERSLLKYIFVESEFRIPGDIDYKKIANLWIRDIIFARCLAYSSNKIKPECLKNLAELKNGLSLCVLQCVHQIVKFGNAQLDAILHKGSSAICEDVQICLKSLEVEDNMVVEVVSQTRRSEILKRVFAIQDLQNEVKSDAKNFNYNKGIMDLLQCLHALRSIEYNLRICCVENCQVNGSCLSELTRLNNVIDNEIHSQLQVFKASLLNSDWKQMDCLYYAIIISKCLEVMLSIRYRIYLSHTNDDLNVKSKSLEERTNYIQLLQSSLHKVLRLNVYYTLNKHRNAAELKDVLGKCNKIICWELDEIKDHVVGNKSIDSCLLKTRLDKLDIIIELLENQFGTIYSQCDG